MRLPSGQNDLNTLSDDSDDVFSNRVKDRARQKVREKKSSWKTPESRKHIFSSASEGASMTPEEIYKKIRTPKHLRTQDSPMERRLKKEIRRDFSPVHRYEKSRFEGLYSHFPKIRTLLSLDS